MDSFFGIGPSELVMILILAGLVMGPRQIRRVARQLGYWSVRFRGIYQAFLSQINSELDALDDGGELRGALDEVRTIGKEVNQTRNDLMSGATSMLDDSKNLIRETEDEVKVTLSDPPPKASVPAPPRPVEVKGDAS